MGAWVTDFLSGWAGIEGYVRHVNSQFRAPAFEHDVTYIDGEVSGKQRNSGFGVPVVEVSYRMTNQDGTELVRGVAEIELPCD